MVPYREMRELIGGGLKSPTVGIKTPDPPNPLEKGEPESGS